jgi:hypothetical protein
MKKQYLYFIALLMAIFIGANSCKKLNSADELSSTTSNSNVQENFFRIPPNTNPTVVRIINELKKLAAEEKFNVEQLVAESGYAKWDKALLDETIQQTNTNGSNAPDSIVLIPLVIGNEPVEKSMICQIDANSIETRIMDSKDFAKYGFAAIDDENLSAKELAVIFMMLNKEVYGYTMFKFTDQTLANSVLGINANLTTQGIGFRLDSATGNTVVGRFDISSFNPAYAIHWITLDPVILVSSPTIPHHGVPFGTLFGIAFDLGLGSGLGGGSTPIFTLPSLSGGNQGGTGGGSNGGTSSSSSNPLPPISPYANSNVALVATALDLNNTQLAYLNQNLNLAKVLRDGLVESTADEDPASQLSYMDVFSPEAIAASKITLKAAMNNLITSAYNENHHNVVKEFYPTSSPLHTNFNPALQAYFTATCAVLKIEHPTWSTARIYWEASQEMIHLALDVGGLVPVIGEICDITNGVIYAIQGDGVNATLSFVASIPIAGWAASGAKFAKRTLMASDGTKRTLYLVKKIASNGAEIITFGNRAQLRRVLALAKFDLRVAHHVIPWSLSIHPLVQKAAEAGFHMNELYNGIPLNIIQHGPGGHLVYNTIVWSKLEQLWANLLSNNGTALQAEAELINLTNQIKNWIVAHPNQSINGLILP